MPQATPEDPQDYHGGPPRYDGPMVRLHNPESGIQVCVAEAKAARLLTNGYREGPYPSSDDKQPEDRR
jgi:hypothetical protein